MSRKRRSQTKKSFQNLNIELKKEKVNFTKWTNKLDEKLVELVGNSKIVEWDVVASNFEQFSESDCLKRFRFIKNITKSKGPWNKTEDDLLKYAIKKLGNSSWLNIASLVAGRNSKQCRERWCNQINPNINHSPFSLEEEELLIAKQLELGNKWSKIAKFFKGRPDNMLKNMWHSLCTQRKLNTKKNNKSKRRKQRNTRKTKNPIGLNNTLNTRITRSTRSTRSTRKREREILQGITITNVTKETDKIRKIKESQTIENKIITKRVDNQQADQNQNEIIFNSTNTNTNTNTTPSTNKNINRIKIETQTNEIENPISTSLNEQLSNINNEEISSIIQFNDSFFDNVSLNNSLKFIQPSLLNSNHIEEINSISQDPELIQYYEEIFNLENDPFDSIPKEFEDNLQPYFQNELLDDQKCDFYY